MKWPAQPERRSNSWRATIKEQRRQVAKVIRQNPSLKSRLEEIYSETYETAIYRASAQTNLDEALFRQLEPFGFGQALDADFWPD